MSSVINNFFGISDILGKLCFVGQDCYKILRQCPNLSKYFVEKPLFSLGNRTIDALQEKYCLKGKAIEVTSGFYFDSPAACFSSFYETRKVVQYDTRVSVIDPEATAWLLKHEFSHIKNNDSPKMDALSAILDVASLCFLPSALQLVGMYSAKIILASTFNKNKEISADDFAIQESTIEELKGGIRWCEAEIRAETFYCKEHPIIGATMKVLLKLFTPHPAMRSRQEKIEKALLKRAPTSDLQVIKTDKKVQQLTEILRFNKDNSVEALLATTFGFRYEKLWKKTDDAYMKTLHPSL